MKTKGNSVIVMSFISFFIICIRTEHSGSYLLYWDYREMNANELYTQWTPAKMYVTLKNGILLHLDVTFLLNLELKKA